MHGKRIMGGNRWQDDHRWIYAMSQAGGSTQEGGLCAEVLAFGSFTQETVNMISDSIYHNVNT